MDFFFVRKIMPTAQTSYMRLKAFILFAVMTARNRNKFTATFVDNTFSTQND